MSGTAKGTWARPRLGVAIALPPGLAAAPTLNLSVDAKAIHTNRPFTLTLSAKGFEQTVEKDW